MLASDKQKPVKKNGSGLYSVIEKILLVGMLGSIALMIFGAVVSLAKGQPLPDHVESPLSALQGLVHLDSTGIVSLGILVLMATPVTYVLAGLIEFITERNWKFITMTTAVLVILAISVLLGVSGH